MARTYRKCIRMFTCYGDNRDFYKFRRRKIKNAGRMKLRTLMANYSPEEVTELWSEPRIPIEDQWAEPTDGHYSTFKKHRHRFYENEKENKLLNRYVKNKHYKY